MGAAGHRVQRPDFTGNGGRERPQEPGSHPDPSRAPGAAPGRVPRPRTQESIALITCLMRV